MSDVAYVLPASNTGDQSVVFFCPGCRTHHPVRIKAGEGERPRPVWAWNRSVTAPTFRPSLLCNQHDPATRCHSLITDGRIEFYRDCHHELAGQTVPLGPHEWD